MRDELRALSVRLGIVSTSFSSQQGDQHRGYTVGAPPCDGEAGNPQTGGTDYG